MNDFFNPSPLHPLAYFQVPDNKCTTYPESQLYIFGEYGCITTETFSSYLKNLKSKNHLIIKFLFPSEKEFLTERIDRNSDRRFDLMSTVDKGKPLLVDGLGRAHSMEELLKEIKKELYDVELESREIIKGRAVERFCENYFEKDRELFLLFLQNQK